MKNSALNLNRDRDQMIPDSLNYKKKE